MYKLFLVEDDATITGALERQLSKWGYEVVVTEDFDRVLEEFQREQPELVLLDITLPHFNGFYWCQEIRKISTVPIIFISSADSDLNLIMAINQGADDFVAKPFSVEVLLAKLQAVLRRSYGIKSEVRRLRAGEAVFCPEEGYVSCGEKRLLLSGNEYKIFKILMERAGTVVERNEIIERLWESEQFIDDNTLTVNIARLRKKLEEIGLNDFIITKKGIGYQIQG
ncbi:MAG: response regulator transcription factor [Acetivibrio ethanolgignens]